MSSDPWKYNDNKKFGSGSPGASPLAEALHSPKKGALIRKKRAAGGRAPGPSPPRPID